MKRFLLTPAFAFLAVSALTSCQKEEKTALELTQELTQELQKVVDYRTAEAVAPRVEVLNKRMQNASVRPFALNETALTRSAASDSEGSEGAAYAEALAQLAAEIGRIQASTPVATADGEIDRDRLLLAVGAANGSSLEASATERKKAGLKYLQDTTGTHETPGNFAEYYGSDKLREALAYKADASEVPLSKMDAEEDVPAIPAAADMPEDEEIPSDDALNEEPAAEDGADEPVATDEEPTTDEETTTTDEEPTTDDSSDDGGEIDLDTEETTDDSSDSGDLDLGGDSDESSDGDLDLGDEDTGDTEDMSLDLDL